MADLDLRNSSDVMIEEMDDSFTISGREEGAAAQTPSKLKRSGLPISIVVSLVILSVFLPMAILLAGQIRQTADALIAKDRAQVEVISGNFRVLYSTIQQASFRRLEVLASVFAGNDPASCQTNFADMLATADELINIVAVDRDGDVICEARSLGPSINISDREYFRRAERTPRAFGSNLLVGRVSGQPLQMQVLPLQDAQGNFDGLIVAGLKLDWLISKVLETKDLLLLDDGEINVSLFDSFSQKTLTTPDPTAWSDALINAEMKPEAVTALELADTTGRMRIYATSVLDPEQNIFLAVSIPENKMTAQARFAKDNSSQFLLFGGLLALGFSLFVGHRILVVPIQRLKDGADGITSLGAVEIGTLRAPREVNDLRASINKLAASLARRTENLSQSNANLRNANADLSAFTYAASHDLKSPVNSVDMVLTELAETKDLNQMEAQELIGAARGALARMQNMIRDVLTFAQIVGDKKASYEVEQCDLNDVLYDVREDLANQIQQADASIHVSPLPVITGNPTLLHVLFLNLLSNALKYRHPERQPEIRVWHDDGVKPGWSVINVGDNGIGIEPKYHDRVFELFKRLHSQDDVDGTGIGLGICARVAMGHGGRIDLTSTPGEGSTFRFWLPSHLEKH